MNSLKNSCRYGYEKFSDVNTSILTKSILRAVLVVGDNLLRQQAVLLPQVSQVFKNLKSENSTTSTDSDESNEEDLEFEVVTECIMNEELIYDQVDL